MKRCCKCKEEKEDSCFYRNKNKKDGLSLECKQCEKTRKDKFYSENIEYIRKKKREESHRNSARRLSYNKKKYHEDIEKSRQEGRDKYWANREKYRENQNKLIKTEPYRKKARERSCRWRKDCKEEYNAFQRYYRKKNSIKTKAVQKVNDAIRYGKLIRPTQCSLCLSPTDIQAHHHDYSKPLEVIWLCRTCHCKEHGKLLDIQ